MKDAKIIPFGLKSIHTDEFATLEVAPTGDDKVALDHRFTFALGSNLNELIATFKLMFTSTDKPFIILQVSCVYVIEGEDFLVSKKGKPLKIQIPKELIIHLASLTASTARGVLHARLENSDHNRYLLPIIDLSKAFEKDLTFEVPH